MKVGDRNGVTCLLRSRLSLSGYHEHCSLRPVHSSMGRWMYHRSNKSGDIRPVFACNHDFAAQPGHDALRLGHG